MSRGRHAKRSGLLARLWLVELWPVRLWPVGLWPVGLWPVRLRPAALRPAALRPSRHRRGTPLRSAAPDAGLLGQLRALDAELSRLRVLGIAHAAAAASADVRARRAEEQLGAVRQELAALREELVWAFAEGRLPVAAPAPAPARVLDLRDGAARSA